jgi:Predicted membrane protein (DUF2254)
MNAQADRQQRSRRNAWLYPLAILGAMALAWFALLVLLDYLVTFEGDRNFWTVFSSYSAEEIRDALGNLPEVVVAILGIAITMISFILQLAATRYTTRVTEMFFRDRTNLLVMGFFVVSSVHCVWATFMLRKTFIPHILVFSTMAMMTLAILILIPYFSYVFAFLDPSRIVARLQDQSLAEAMGRRSHGEEQKKERVLEGVEQLADVAVNSISQKDRIIASRSVDALKDLALGYLERKGRLDRAWFAIGPLLRRNPDFVGMAPESVDELSEQGTWLEWKIMRQYQTIFNESLNRMRDIGQLVAINTRYLGEAALAAKDEDVLALVTKFFNTFLRATINLRDVRTSFNVLHQYRLLAEQLLHAEWNQRTMEVARYFKYYGQLANTTGLSFVNETAAYDLCTLCELAHDEKFTLELELLDTLLEVDKDPENEAQEKSLRGVRKAQIKLATFYLVRGAEKLARRVWRDMEHEASDRLRSIREEMLQVRDKDFWEVIDRGYNFDYLEPDRRVQLEVFYSWFPGLFNSDRPTVQMALSTDPGPAQK